MSEQYKDLTIDRMKEGDLEEVLRIEKESFSDPWTKESFLEDIKKDFTYPAVVRKEEKLIGYTCLWKIEDELQIANIAVDKEHRRQGIAQKMMEWIFEQGLKNKCKSVTLDVRVSNLIALSLYRKLGFDPIGRRKNYYRFPVEDAIIMEKKL
ncbi:MAG TPA: ribosomal protein S18-alanine N-acetyltransferase [Terriglobales bacterium]|nr:ribosomal protein S18-alanine N-acetyltransferase [Terriglobales bacterium]